VTLTLLALAVSLWPSAAAAQVTVLENLYLQEFGPFVARQGGWNIYSFPGAPLGIPFGAGFAVSDLCEPSGFGGIFLSAGQGFGDMALTSPWPFPQGTILGQDISGNPLDLCDPNADEAWWFLYGNSLNNLPGGVTGGIARFFGAEQTIVDGFCSTVETEPEGIFFFARRSAERQQFDIFCSNQTDGQMTLRAGNVLICRFPLGATWVDPFGVPTGIHLGPLFGLATCQWYATCSARPVGGVVPRSTCAVPGGPGGPVAPVIITVLNGNNQQPVPGASVTFPGGPTQTTDASGQTTFTSVPTGVSTTFTATAPGFGPGSGAVTAVAGATTPLTILLPVIVSCSPFSHSGGDVGDTQVVEMGKTPATFQFDWATFSVKDRVVISHDGTTLFDSGCVGSSGSQTLNYSGGSTQVRVQVFANCEGDTGTAWEYTVHCPAP
jgi:hypothetical protein